MSYTIQKHLTKVNKGTKGKNNPQWIIVHYVGASGQAWANANYFHSVYRGSSAHYFLDKGNIVQVVEDDTPAWQVGDGSRSKKGKFNGYVGYGATNNNAIGFELCQDTSTGSNVYSWQFHKETLNRAEWLIKQKQKQYNIPDSRVIRHYDASGKNCPGNWASNNWAQWWAFKERLAGVKDNKPSGTVSKDDGKPTVNAKTYTIKSGDTLSAIAKEHGVKLDDLIAWNDIENPSVIYPDTVLFVSKPKADEPKTDIEKLALETIANKYGSGEDRKKALGKNYDAVQARVNEILLGNSKPAPSKPSTPKPTSGKVTLSTSAKNYATGESIPASVKGKQYTIQQSRKSGSELLLKEIMSWVYAKDVSGEVKPSTGSKPSAGKTPSSGAGLTGKVVTLNSGATKYATGQSIPASVKGKRYTVQQVKGDGSQVLLKEIMSWVYTKDVSVGSTATAPKKPTSKKFNLPTGVYSHKSPLLFGNDVKVIQEALASIYFYPDKGAKNNGIDGFYGAKTVGAVKRFQSMYGLKADGVYGAGTRAKLDSLVNK